MSVIFGIKENNRIIIAGDKRGSSIDGKTLSDDLDKVLMINDHLAFSSAGNAAIEKAISIDLNKATNKDCLTTDDLLDIIKAFYKRVADTNCDAILALPFYFLIEETGKAAVEIDKQIALKYEGKLTDNKVQQMMSEFKPTQDLHGMNAKYIYQNALQSSVFSHFADIDGNWNGLSVADVFGDKEIKVGYVNGWLSTSQNMAKIFIVLSLVIILLIAPVFSGEYGGVDNIILTSKYGKTKCATAKVLASLLSAVFITTLVVIFNLLIAVAIYGTEGLDCSILFAPIDFLEGYIPFNITCGTVLKYQILLAFMSAISVTGIVLILSAVCKSQMIAFVISAAIHVIPIMLPISETSALYRIIVLMPLFYSQYISIMSVEQMHNGMLYAVWSIPVAIALVVIGSIISHKAFSKHQVR